MKKVNIYKDAAALAALSRKEVIKACSSDKKAVSATLSNYANSIDAAGAQLIKDAATRNAANAAKGQFGGWLKVVAACYPYQTKEGKLCSKRKGLFVEKRLSGTASAYSVVKMSLQNFIACKYGRKAELIEIVEVTE